MTDLTDLVFEALPAVGIVVTDLPPSDGAWVIDFGTGEYILISNYYGPYAPRPLVCSKHGAQRFDWNGKRFVCKVCHGDVLEVRAAVPLGRE
jgi:hypothetical protein